MLNSLVLIVAVLQTVIVSAASCPEQYRRLYEKHTACLPLNNQCNIFKRGVSEADKKIIVKVHNEFRDKIAQGKMTGMPKASNMMQMVWDDELSLISQAHSDQCKFEHDCSECRQVERFRVGQNLFLSWSTQKSTDNEWAKAIESWNSEASKFEPGHRKPFKFSTTTGHFTQDLWADTWRVGCGVTHYEDNSRGRTAYSSLYTCNYGPAGNVIGTSMYEEGKPCSQCPKSSTCSTRFTGLCMRTRRSSSVAKKNTDLHKKPRSHRKGAKMISKRILNCEFRSSYERNCPLTITPRNAFRLVNTTKGGTLRAVIRPGETASLKVNKPLSFSRAQGCIKINYRQGPFKPGKATTAEASVVMSKTYASASYTRLPVTKGFKTFSVRPSGPGKYKMTLRFSIPRWTKQKEFFDLRSLSATESKC